jgi:hypothetical protein
MRVQNKITYADGKTIAFVKYELSSKSYLIKNGA